MVRWAPRQETDPVEATARAATAVDPRADTGEYRRVSGLTVEKDSARGTPHPTREVSDMIEAVGLTKRYGDRVAVDQLSFSVRPGQVTGFLGPNGAGKSTTMRMILGLDTPSGGRVTIDGS